MPIKVSKYPELERKNALKQFKDEPELKKYVPDFWFEPKAWVDRRYLFTILNTFKRDFMKQLVNNSHLLWQAKVSVNGLAKNIVICEEVAALHDEFVMTPSKLI